ncbi:PAS/PAC sensor signal transduction histidine kinase [Nitritalea halalkaliphila LW7]|uniref:histidine kinase n=2 Tax=Nitritalea TaxID=1187887 RepID=I5C8D2_9BACT|nr:PAS/PAC sensor signal transduction histidine kinase [Nitritalea halalkaliphila LW7]
MDLAELQLKEVDLHASIENNCASIRALLLLNGVQVINKIPEKTCVAGIQAYIDSIVLNFITNAVKYKRSEAKEGCQLLIALEETDTHKIVHFQDNGIGIDMKLNGGKLFGLYKTFHKHPDARGVGLFLTKGQVEAMGGFITVQSTKGLGTTFSVHFPLQ